MARVLVTQHVFDLHRIGNSLQGQRVGVRVDADGEIHLRTPHAKVQLRLSEYDKGVPLLPGDLVYVWWHAGGFVCAPADEVDDTDRRRFDMKEEVRRTREKLALARLERESRFAALPDSAPRDTQPSMFDPFI